MPSAHPGLSDEEYQRLLALRQRGGRGSGWRVLAGDLNRMRTADVYSPAVVAERSVSHEWVRKAFALAAMKRQDASTVKMLGLASKNGQASRNLTFGGGMVRRLSNAEPSTNEQPLLDGQESKAEGPFAPEVNSEQTGATQ